MSGLIISLHVIYCVKYANPETDCMPFLSNDGNFTTLIYINISHHVPECTEGAVSM